MSMSLPLSDDPLENPTPGNADQAWQILSDRLDAFCAAWERGEAPELAEFIAGASPAMRRIVLVELIKIDLDYRWSRNVHPRLLESYAEEFPELANSLPADLLYEEFHVRRQAGHQVVVAEYAVRFADRFPEFQRLMGLSDSGESTALYHRRIPAAVNQLKPGDRIDDFELLTTLGQGTFARVFLAWQRSMHRLVALKISGDFGTEPQLLAQLDHENIVRVYDLRYLGEQGIRLLYMQYLPGGSLHAVVDAVRAVPPSVRRGAVLLRTLLTTLEGRGEIPAIEAARRAQLAAAPWHEVVTWIGAQLARALEYSHQRGVLHRDIKPANVLLSADASPRLVDFNVSYGDKLEGVTPAAFFGGSLVYMSPEQLEAFDPTHARQAGSLDGRSDIYSLGIMLWELQTGSRAFPEIPWATSWKATLECLVCQRRSGLPVDPVAELAWRDAPELRAIIARCLAPDPDQRFRSAAELARHLELLLDPSTRRLFHPPPRSWRVLSRRFPLVAMILAAILPNAIAAVFNLAHNRQEIIDRLQEGKETFEMTQLVVNFTAFPLGLGLLIWLSRPIRLRLEGTRAGATDSLEADYQARRRGRRLGRIAAGVSLAMWLIAGPVFPIVLQFTMGSIPTSVYVHFVTSLALCGLIAIAYPFFGISCLAIGSYYPPLLRLGEWDGNELAELKRLGRASWSYLLLAASVPMIAVGVLAYSGSQTRFALGALAVAGVLGLTSALAMFRTLQADLAALTALGSGPARLPFPGDAPESGEW